MEHIRIPKVDNVSVLHRGVATHGTLHLTPHHLIFSAKTASPSTSTDAVQKQQKSARPSEIWITYPVIATLHRHPPCASSSPHLRVRNRDFSFLTIQFESDRECRDVFESIKALTIVKGGVEKLYAFYYTPGSAERKCNGWNVYDPLKEYKRMGVGTDACKGWRISKINKDYAFSPTYPALLVVPATISDTTLTHAKNYRSRARIPALTYLHPLNNCSITRCAQPLTGVRGNRSVQDEKLIAAIFASSQPQNTLQTPAYLSSTPSPSGSSTNLETADSGETRSKPSTPEPNASTDAATSPKIYGAQQHNLIVDARPTVNAYAMQAVGMGSENMDNYRHTSSPPCTKTYLHIDNIHVMRDSLQRVVDALKDSDITPIPPNRELLIKSGWQKHIGLLLDGTSVIVRQIAVEHSHVLIHCSDGWDRTSQLSSLAQICLDPYFRTIEGFMALVEKDWLGFGHRFRDRCGFLGSEKWFLEKNGNAPSMPEESSFGEDDTALYSTLRTNAGGGGGGPFSSFAGGSTGGGGLGEALEKGFGQAKLFFNNVSNKSSTDLQTTEAPDETQSFTASNNPTIDRKSKIATAAITPAASPTKPKEVSPVFHQFLDAVYQLTIHHPTRFEYNERFLRRLLYHLYSCQYGTFLFNNEKERVDAKCKHRTRSVWDYFLARKGMWRNELYDPDADGKEREREVDGGRVVFPKLGGVIWWEEVWGREKGDMNGREALNLTSIPMTTTPAMAPAATENKEDHGTIETGPRGSRNAEGVLNNVVEGVKGLGFVGTAPPYSSSPSSSSSSPSKKQMEVEMM